MKFNRVTVFARLSQYLKYAYLLTIISCTSLLINVLPVMAHHAMGSGMPINFWEGFLSGLTHPIIGFDHFAFIVSVGLLAALKRQGILIPIAFIVAAMAGTIVHLMQIGIPGVELFVSGSILFFGVLLVTKDSLNTLVVAGLAAIAGLFHGYAYGEAIFGAGVPPILAYLTGFSVIQSVIAVAVFGIGKAILHRSPQPVAADFRPAGWVICGVGLAFLASQIVAILFSISPA